MENSNKSDRKNNSEKQFRNLLIEKYSERSSIKKEDHFFFPYPGFDDFIKANPEVFEYLNNKFGIPITLNLLHYALMETIHRYPMYSDIDYRNFFTESFYYDDTESFLNDPRRYFITIARKKWMASYHGSKESNQEEQKSENYVDLTLYIASIIYNKLRIYDLFNTSYEYLSFNSELSNAYDFHPLATNKYALNQSYIFHGWVDHVAKKKNNQGSDYEYFGQTVQPNPENSVHTESGVYCTVPIGIDLIFQI